MRVPLALFALLLCSCARDATGYTTTHDGRLVAETAEVSRDEFAHRAGTRAADAAGPGWKAVATIGALPLRDEVKADEWGWKSLPIDLLLVPPAGASTEGAVERAEKAVRDIAMYRVHRTADIALTTHLQEAAAPLPGSQRYTVVAGDTLAGISTAFYGSSQHWRLIADANPAVEVAPGAVLVIPPKP